MSQQATPDNKSSQNSSSQNASSQNSGPQNSGPGFFAIAISDGIPKRSFMTALVMGTVLNAVNYGDAMVAGDPLPALKMIVTYILPYFVSTWGAVGAKRAQLRAG
ncbi:nitrate/nitrite transporter NrtS [Alphaproteobacteria bacterium]|nr:nitrate/nitrite transporter NrtS [Alphaproteobacteria bacterium]